MLSIFLGLTLAQFIGLAFAFYYGMTLQEAGSADTATGALHISIAMGAGFLTTASHCVVYVYFMATTKWLRAATDKAGLSKAKYSDLSSQRKKHAFFCLFIAVGTTMLTMFAGAATQTQAFPFLPARIHLYMALATITVNLLIAGRELN